MTKQQFNDEFVRQFTSNDQIHPFTRYKHIARAFVAYAGSDFFWDLPEKEKPIACAVFRDQLHAYDLLIQQHEELFVV